jgi:hypothetical protein
VSGTGEFRADFAGEERAFRIRLGEIRRIEDKCKTGIGEVVRRLSRCVYLMSQMDGIQALAAGVDIHADDVREVIFQGLRGAEVSDSEATKLVRREIDDRGLRGILDHASTALEVLWGSQETPDAGEPQAGESPAIQPSDTTSEPSTEPEPPSA